MPGKTRPILIGTYESIDIFVFDCPIIVDVLKQTAHSFALLRGIPNLILISSTIIPNIWRVFNWRQHFSLDQPIQNMFSEDQTGYGVSDIHAAVPILQQALICFECAFIAGTLVIKFVIGAISTFSLTCEFNFSFCPF